VTSAIEGGGYRQQRTKKPIPEFNPDIRSTQLERLNKVKAERDNSAVDKALAGVRQAVAQKENVVPRLIEAAGAYATLGEMVRALKSEK
jgi:methylmalonyl-CoA mutase N-terminal domain/subunit